MIKSSIPIGPYPDLRVEQGPIEAKHKQNGFKSSIPNGPYTDLRVAQGPIEAKHKQHGFKSSIPIGPTVRKSFSPNNNNNRKEPHFNHNNRKEPHFNHKNRVKPQSNFIRNNEPPILIERQPTSASNLKSGLNIKETMKNYLIYYLKSHYQ